jgi:hypothetical protein
MTPEQRAQKIIDDSDSWSGGATKKQIVTALNEAITEAQVATVEECLESFRNFSLSREEALLDVESLSPDKDWLARKRAEARLEEAKWWAQKFDKESVGIGTLQKRISGLEQLAKGKEEG